MNCADDFIDLRSDTVTMPCDGMRSAMQNARVGDDVYGEDPTVRLLEETLAQRMGKAAGLLLPTGTQSNLVALLTHCGRGDEFIAGQQSHTYKYEGGGGAVLGGIQPQPLEFCTDGTLDLESVRLSIKPRDIHFARTSLMCLETTMQGKVLPLEYLLTLPVFAQQHDLRLHLDGARVFNASVAMRVDVKVITAMFDSISVCLSKGLGAPAGSVLLGSAPFIREARRWRKVVGGGMRQSGILAAAGLYALEHNVERLADDHSRAIALGNGLVSLGFQVDPIQTNMVYVDCNEIDVEAMRQRLLTRSIRITPSKRLRLVTHLGISDHDIALVLEAFADSI
jgi:threonine aldolase